MVVFLTVVLRVPTPTGKPGKMGILNRLEKSGKVTQNTGKLKEFQKILFVILLILYKMCIICENGSRLQFKKSKH